MTQDLFSLREKEIFSTLNELKYFDFVIIGGYAVNAYVLPRFSVDCDLVIKEDAELKKIEIALLKIGYRKTKLPKEAGYSGRFVRYEKRLANGFAVSMDILIANVIDRMTGAEFAADWIFENSGIKKLRGKTFAEAINTRIINIDALLVMKIISCRATDIRDVFMMFAKAKDPLWIKSEIKSRCDFSERISKIIQKVDSKQFKDGLSGVFGRFDQKTFEKYRKEILAFQSL